MAELESTVLAWTDKGLPARADGLTVREFLDSGPRLSEFWTPLLALSDDAIDNNLAVMKAWCAAHGIALMPHGKTTMAPALWQRQIDAGAAGITLATVGQVRVARQFGFDSIMLANSAVDARGLRFIAAELADPELSLCCWADSVETVDVMERALAGLQLARPIDVCVELGAAGGRTGARTSAEAREIAQRLHDSTVLRLAGVAGYEGALGHDRSAKSIGAVRDYLGAMTELHLSLRDLYDDAEVILTAGGSAYFDAVAEVFAGVQSSLPRTRVVVRSGAYLTHDSGFYRGISPLDASFDGDSSTVGTLTPALRGLVRVVSRPEPELVLVDAGKRDLPFDEGLPEPRGWAADLGEPMVPLDGASVVAMNDQHSFVRVPADAPLGIGAVVTVGVSHPCTAFDKWRYIPVTATETSDLVVDLVKTYF